MRSLSNLEPNRQRDLPTIPANSIEICQHTQQISSFSVANCQRSMRLSTRNSFCNVVPSPLLRYLAEILCFPAKITTASRVSPRRVHRLTRSARRNYSGNRPTLPRREPFALLLRVSLPRMLKGAFYNGFAGFVPHGFRAAPSANLPRPWKGRGDIRRAHPPRGCARTRDFHMGLPTPLSRLCPRPWEKP